MQGVHTLYYRGGLRSCNYSCHYCPFSKTRMGKLQLSEDQQQLSRFVRAAGKMERLRNVMFIPYGEALVHQYYWKQFEILSGMPHLQKIGCQTNLSFSAGQIADRYPGLQTGKMHLWCTYHPTEVTMNSFLNRCEELQRAGIRYSVGAVGDISQIGSLKELRKNLDPGIYFWINAMDGRTKPYTAIEIKQLSELDPLFEQELKVRTCRPDLCSAGKETVMVSKTGDLYACILSGIKIGNLYQGVKDTKAESRAKYCNCYLAYHHRQDERILGLFGNNRWLRIPEKKFRAVFFDVDGTLTDQSGSITQSTAQMLAYLRKNSDIYLCTSRPYESVRPIMGGLMEIIAGGVFAEGADCRSFCSGYHSVKPLNTELLGKDLRLLRFYRRDGIAYKAIMRKSPDQWLRSEYHVVREDGITGITARGTSKLNGVKELCRVLGLKDQEILVVGNGKNDVELLGYYPNSIAVSGALEQVKMAAAAVMGTDQLRMF